MSWRGYLRECYLKPRGTETLFNASGLPTLERYAVIPREDYDGLRSLLEDLVRAVEPFANYAAVDSDGPDVSWALHWRGEDGKMTIVSKGDLRRAREAYLKAHSHTEKETG